MTANPEVAARAPFWSELDALVFAGAYEEVTRRAAAGFSDGDAPAVVAALALAGRLDEAESVYEARLRSRGGPLAQARFFLVAGLCHAGSPAKASALVRQSASAVRRASPPERYWACQGLALLRHFEGHFSRARRAVRLALAAAVEAEFPYGRFLSLDLSAHVAVATGQIHAGMRLLTQASELADALGYVQNAATERAARLLFELRFAIGDEAALHAVTDLVMAPGVSYFTRRNGLLELSAAHALRGEASAAQAALEQARRIALPGADRRAQARYFTGHALCSALSHGAERARESLGEARAEARQQLALLGEIAFVELVLCGERSAADITAAQRIARLTGAERVRVACAIASGQSLGSPARFEDGLCRLLLEMTPLDTTRRLRRLIETRMLGLLPWALGAPPGQRLILLGKFVIAESHGNVNLGELAHRPARKLLLELGRGYRSRADLLRDVWNIGSFVPARHTPTLHTTVSRLRVALGDADWIVTHDDGYALAEGVELLVFGAEAAAPTSPGTPSSPPADDRQRVLALIAADGTVSSADVARGLELSSSTALRALRRLVEDGELERIGSGRATRYRRRGRGPGPSGPG